MVFRHLSSSLLAVLGLLAWPATHDAMAAAPAGQARAAVAANFTHVARLLADQYAQQSGNRIAISAASTGKLYAQIRHGAPFDLLLAADDTTPQRLVDEGLAVRSTLVAYASGRLVLWSRDPALIPSVPIKSAPINSAPVESAPIKSAPIETAPVTSAPIDPAPHASGERVLRQRAFHKLAIANPELAPYGAAAREVLQHIGRWHALQPRLVLGENVGQATQFVMSGNAEAGLLPRSLALEAQRQVGGSSWLVPASWHQPIIQSAVLLHRGRDNPAARGFLEYLHSESARRIMAAHGYD